MKSVHICHHLLSRDYGYDKISRSYLLRDCLNFFMCYIKSILLVTHTYMECPGHLHTCIVYRLYMYDDKTLNIVTCMEIICHYSPSLNLKLCGRQKYEVIMTKTYEVIHEVILLIINSFREMFSEHKNLA